MKKLCALTFVFPFVISSLFAQLYDNIWLTGVLGGSSQVNANLNFTDSRIDFSQKPPLVSEDSDRLFDMRICGTSISDDEGNLLFYSNCYRIANKENNLMENGDSMFLSYNSSLGLANGSLDVQGAIVLPAPSNPTEYYFFNINTTAPPVLPYEVGTHLLFSKIDMTGDNGLGAVTQKRQVLIEDEIQLNGLSAVKHANGRDWWLLIFKYQSPIYYKILLTDEGVSIAEQGTIDEQYNARMGSNSFSPDGSKFCVVPGKITMGSNFYFDVYNFDRCTGELNNRKRFYYGQIPVFDPFDYYAQSSAFSPNSKYLFLNTFKEVYQVNP